MGVVQEWVGDILPEIASEIFSSGGTYGCVLGILTFDRQGLALRSSGYREYGGYLWQETAFRALNLQFLLAGLLGQPLRMVKVDYLEDLSIVIVPKTDHYLAALLVREQKNIRGERETPKVSTHLRHLCASRPTDIQHPSEATDSPRPAGL